MSLLRDIFIFLCLLKSTFCFNINDDHIGTLNADSTTKLLGWSLKHFKDDLYIGAPLTSQATGNLFLSLSLLCQWEFVLQGAIYKCSDLKTSPRCVKVAVSDTKTDSWIGSSIAATEKTIFTCGLKRDASSKKSGQCLKNTGNRLTLFTKTTHSMP